VDLHYYNVLKTFVFWTVLIKLQVLESKIEIILIHLMSQNLYFKHHDWLILKEIFILTNHMLVVQKSDRTSSL